MKNFGLDVKEKLVAKYLDKDVPKDLWSRFKQADSLGSFYNRQIKGRYEY